MNWWKRADSDAELLRASSLAHLILPRRCSVPSSSETTQRSTCTFVFFGVRDKLIFQPIFLYQVPCLAVIGSMMELSRVRLLNLAQVVSTTEPLRDKAS